MHFTIRISDEWILKKRTCPSLPSFCLVLLPSFWPELPARLCRAALSTCWGRLLVTCPTWVIFLWSFHAKVRVMVMMMDLEMVMEIKGSSLIEIRSWEFWRASRASNVSKFGKNPATTFHRRPSTRTPFPMRRSPYVRATGKTFDDLRSSKNWWVPSRFWSRQRLA